MSIREESVKVASLSPGRLRLKISPESELSKIGPDLEELLRVPGVTQVAYRKLTSSLLILYDGSKYEESEFLSLLSNAHPHLAVSRPATVPQQAELPRNLLSFTMYHYSDQANRAVHRVTHGLADLTSVFPVVFFAWAVIDLLARPTLPRWFELYREGSYLWHFYQNRTVVLSESQGNSTL